MEPELFFSTLKHRIKKEWILCFCSAIGFGIAAHIYKFLNFLPNWDSLLNLYSSQNKIDLGRCFLSVGCLFGSYYDLPWINGMLSLLYLALSAVCISILFDVKKKHSPDPHRRHGHDLPDCNLHDVLSVSRRRFLFIHALHVYRCSPDCQSSCNRLQGQSVRPFSCLSFVCIQPWNLSGLPGFLSDTCCDLSALEASVFQKQHKRAFLPCPAVCRQYFYRSASLSAFVSADLNRFFSKTL